MGEEEEITTLRVKVSTRDDLASCGNKDDTFDDIIRRLINFYKKGAKE